MWEEDPPDFLAEWIAGQGLPRSHLSWVNRSPDVARWCRFEVNPGVETWLVVCDRCRPEGIGLAGSYVGIDAWRASHVICQRSEVVHIDGPIRIRFGVLAGQCPVCRTAYWSANWGKVVDIERAEEEMAVRWDYLQEARDDSGRPLDLAPGDRLVAGLDPRYETGLTGCRDCRPWRFGSAALIALRRVELRRPGSVEAWPYLVGRCRDCGRGYWG